MKNKLVIVLGFFLIFAILISSVSLVYADSSAIGTEQVISAMKGMNDKGFDSNTEKKLGPIVNTAIGFIQIVGTGISVIMVTVLGIKYMLAAPGEKAEVKKQITPLVIGAVILFASANIIQIVVNFAGTLPTG